MSARAVHPSTRVSSPLRHGGRADRRYAREPQGAAADPVEREQAERDKPPAKPSTGGAPRVYLICDQNDEAALEPLEDFFYDHGIEVSLPGFEAEESEVQQIHIQNLRDCDAALIYYGAAGMHWVDFKIRELQKAAGYRDSRPIPVSAVYVALRLATARNASRACRPKSIQQPDDNVCAGIADGLRDGHSASEGGRVMNAIDCRVPNSFPGLRPSRTAQACPRDSELLTLPAQTTQDVIGYAEERTGRKPRARRARSA